MRTEPVGESAYVALCIHPVGAELGGVRATDDTARENQWAHTEAGEKPPSVAYESDAVRRLDTTPPPPAGSGDGRSRRGGQIGGVCLFVGVDSARRPPRGPSAAADRVPHVTATTNRNCAR